jgi:hypothetical protein
MKHPLESLLTAGGILLMALLSCLLLPAPSLGLVLAQKLMATFHMVDLNQLYTILFCLWFGAWRHRILYPAFRLAPLVFTGVVSR